MAIGVILVIMTWLWD